MAEHVPGDLGDLLADGMDGVKCGERVLKDHGHPAAPGAPGLSTGARDLLASEPDSTVLDRGWRGAATLPPAG